MGGRGVWSLAVVLCSVLVSSRLQSQEVPDSLASSFSWEFGEEAPGFSITDLVTPESVRDARRIRAYVRDPRFELLRQRDGDVRAADAIYLRALRIARYDVGRALLLSLLATLEHRTLPLKMPLVGVLNLPLTFEEEELFRARVRQLPRKLYPDSPAGEQGDRDKLQHFFGAAAVAYATESAEAARTAGTLVEWGESVVVVGGVDDPRDLRSNIQGEMFGHDLLYLTTMLPSDYLRLRVHVQ